MKKRLSALLPILTVFAKNTEAEFPDARASARPGFDETVPEK
jgi:hypothetical protein